MHDQIKHTQRSILAWARIRLGLRPTALPTCAKDRQSKATADKEIQSNDQVLLELATDNGPI